MTPKVTDLNEFAIGSSGLGEALKRSASAMYAANNTLEETIGLATAANTILQNPQSVGTMLKTVSMYVRAAKTELEEAGEDTEGIAESTGKLRELIKQITAEGGKAVDIMADEDTFKSTYQILEEISEVWDKISDTNQAALLEKLGGKRNANAISAILENFDIAREAMEAATNAEGSAMEELAKYQESIEGHIVRLKTSFQELSSTVIDSDLVKTIVDMGGAILDLITKIGKLVQTLGGLKTVLISISGIITIRTITKITTSFEQLVRVSGGLGKALGYIFGKTGSGISGIGSALKSLASGLLGPAGIMTAALALVTGTIAAVSAYKRKQAEMRNEMIETGKEAAASSDEIIDLYDRYTKLNDQVALDGEAKKELADITDQLLEKLGIEKQGVKDLSGEYQNLTDKINDITLDKLYENLTKIDAAVAAAEERLVNKKSQDGFGEMITGYDFNRIYASDSKAYQSEIIELLNESGYLGVQKHTNGNTFVDLTKLYGDNRGGMNSASDLIMAYNDIIDMMKVLSRNGYGDSKLFAELGKRSSRIKAEVNELLDLYNQQETVQDQIDKILNPDSSSQGSAGIQNRISEIKAERDAIIDRETALRDYIEAYNDLVSIEQEAENAGYSDISETVFGNIDTNSRQILEWTQENIDKYRDILLSWGYTEEDLQDMLGSFSTVMGTSMNFDNLEIAFSPILQTEDGPVLLSSDAVERYIIGLMEELASDGASWTDEDLLRLDTRGLEIDGVNIKNILASVGSEAIRVGEVMHYAGSDGALADAFLTLRSAANKAGVPLNRFRDNIGSVTEEADKCRGQIDILNQEIAKLESEANAAASEPLNKAISEYTKKLNILSDAWKEYRENGRITIETMNLLNTTFGEDNNLLDVSSGALGLNAAQVDSLNKKLYEENIILIAAAGATEDQIQALHEMSSALNAVSEAETDVVSDIKDLLDIIDKLNEGTEYSTIEILQLIKKYPELRRHIVRTADGYKIEEQAIRDIIKAKADYISITDKQAAATAKTNFVGTTSSAGAAKVRQNAIKSVDDLFAKYEAETGGPILSLDEYIQYYAKVNNHPVELVQPTPKLIEYINALIDENLDKILGNTLVEEIVDPDKYAAGVTPENETSSSSSSTAEKEETEFEKAYKLHQHYLAIDQETEEQYLAWLEGAYKASYDANEMELDDYYKYEEEVYEKRKALFSQSLDEMQHQIDLLSNQTGDTSAEQIALYEQMQKKVHAKANEYRAMGISDNDELIRELQNQWWQYEENIRQLRENAFSDWLNDKKFLIDQLKQDGASSDEIVNSWKDVLKRINDEIAYYMSKGHDITSDVIQNLMGELKDAKDSITEALDELVAKANEVVDGFQNVYTTLTNAAKEYASTGYLSVDSLQSILELGPKYMDMLYDESGQLTINEEAIQKVIAARTEEMAAETALSYAKQILLATEDNDVKKLRELADVQSESSDATWDLAYSTLGFARALGATRGIGPEFYDKAIENVTKMQSMTRTAVNTIKEASEAMKEGYVSQADGLQTILKLTEDMIKQENSDRIKQLEDEKDAYKDIIEQKKEILRLTKEQNDHDRDMADRLKEISDLQSKIDQLALDDSREARAQRAKLEEQLLEKQKSLTDSQNDYAYDALDKQYDEYEKELDKEAEALKDELNSAEKLYRAAVERITDAWENDWESLKNQLISWNFEVGNTLEKDLTAAWDAATAAAERYGDYVSALAGVKDNDKLGAPSVTPGSESVTTAVNEGAATLENYRNQMYQNSLAWYTAEDKAFYEAENRRLAKEYEELTGNTLTPDSKSGYWYENGSSDPFYTLDRNEVGMAVVAAMKANSEAWKTADKSTQDKLAARNQELADRLAAFLKKPITKTAAGVWMLGNTPLYEVTKFHTGGIVGGRGSLRQNEVMALLKKGESVLDERREEALYKTVDFVQMLSDKIGHVIDKGRLSSLLAGTGASFPRGALPALAGGGIGTMNFAPTIQVTITGAGDLTESAARKYGNIAAESALAQLKSAFSQRGVSAPGNSILK